MMTFISARKPLSDLTCYRKMKVTGSECKHKGKYKVSVNIFLWILPIVQFNISFLKFLRYFHCVWLCKARFRPTVRHLWNVLDYCYKHVVSSQIKTLYKYKYKANLNFSELSDKRINDLESITQAAPPIWWNLIFYIYSNRDVKKIFWLLTLHQIVLVYWCL